MATEIEVWQIINGNLEAVDISMTEAKRREGDFEGWIKNNPKILGQDILVIGEQVSTKSGPMDLLGIDRSGNTVIAELKRDKLPREVLTQAIDYASDVASWNLDKINEICTKHTGQKLEDCLSENFEDTDLQNLPINETQRILLIGFSIEDSLQRMIEWLSNNYGVSINAAILKYIKTKNGDELIARTAIIPEERRIGVGRGTIQVSDEPGNYNDEELYVLLSKYLSENRAAPRRIREILLPLCLEYDVVKREKIKEELIKRGEAQEEGKAGLALTSISNALGFRERDYLRQVIQYDKPYPWEKENYRLVNGYRELIKNLSDELRQS
jgi:hypothetical protein